MSKCVKCSLYEEANHPCMKGRGPKDAKVMIIGEAPGFHEDEQNKPFVGKAGQFLMESLEEAGINPSEVYFTNAVKCRPPMNKTPGKNEIKECQEHLFKEIERVKPEFIITLGNTPLLSVLGKSGITKYRGQTFEAHDAKVFPTLHPAGIFRNPKFLPMFKSDLSRFATYIKGGKVVSIDDYRITIVKTWDKLKRVIKKLKTKKRLAFDFETQNLNWKTGKIWLLGVATSSTRAYIIPLQHPQSPFRHEWEKVMEMLKPVFEDRSKFLIAQNGKFDCKWFRRCGIVPYLNWDTMLASHLLNENEPNSLEYNSMVLLGTDDYKKRHNVKFDPPSPLKQLSLYCGEDCCNTFGVYKKQKPMLAEDPRLKNIFFKLKMPASRMFEKVEMTGLWVDAVKLNKNGKTILKNMVKLEKKLNSLIPKNFPFKYKVYKTEQGFKKAIRSGKFGDDVEWEVNIVEGKKQWWIKEPFNWGSTQQLGQLLYSKKKHGGWGLKPPDIKEAKTKTGNDATGEAILVHMRDQHPGVDLLIEYKGWRQLWNNFIKPWKEMLDVETSRLYPTFKLHGTVTHRLSSENPNPQQTPRNVLIRGNIGAPKGKVFIEADYSQIELRIAAFVSGCPVMTRAFQVGEDIHTKTAIQLSGLDPSKMTPEQLKEFRKKAKPVNFGFLYGMWWKTFKQYAFQNYGQRFSDEECQQAQEAYFNTYVGLKPWHKRQIRLAEKLGYVRYADGTIRRLPDIYSEDKAVRREAEKQAINSPVQGLASNICLTAAVVLDKKIDWDECKMVLSMHDALMFEVDEDKVDKWLPIIKDTMENPPLKKWYGYDLTVPIVVDVKVGRYWGELKDYEEWKKDTD